MNSERINRIVDERALPRFRVKQLRHAFFEEHVSSFADVTTLSKELRAELERDSTVLTLEESHLLRSEDGRAFKALLTLESGEGVETVLMSPKPDHWTVCISCQVGCPVGCTFCATGKMGFHRNLTSEEISDQVLFWRQFAQRERPDAMPRNVVYMGMGEPFLNVKEVYESIDELRNPETFNIGSRHISVSTVGIVPQIRAFGERFPQVNLSISLHAPNDELRQELIPYGTHFPLKMLGQALNEYMALTNRKIFVEYTLMDGTNDQPRHAEELVDYLRTLEFRQLVHVNLIPCNPTGAGYHAPTRKAIRIFQDRLQQAGFPCTTRRSLGQDIAGACGQLAGEKQG